MESESQKFYRLMKEEKNQCQFYAGCKNTKRPFTLSEGKTKYKVCMDCGKRFREENPNIEVTIQCNE